eukprot:scaffold43603_cov63-Phaeocystis_antarctica.AAC.1
MNSHLSTSSKRAKRTGSSLSASLPITRMRGPSAAAVWPCVVERSAGDFLWESNITGKSRRYSAHQRSKS